MPPSPSFLILIVDDTAMIRELISFRLMAHGYQVIEAADGLEAYHQTKAKRPHLIICDIMMPQEDGISFCRRLRAEGDTTPLLFLTAKSQSHNVVEGLASGADDYIVKPFDLNELESRIQTLLRRVPRS